jgi:V/A-type H+-transporting ATPase subunit E
MTPVRDSHPAAPESRLVAVIREQCAAEAAGVIAQAQERAQRARTAAAADAQAFRDAAERDGEERGRRRAAEIVALANADSHREWLRAREQLIDTTCGQAWMELARFPEMPHAARVLAALIHEALAVLPPGALRVQVPEGYERILDDTKRKLVIPDGHAVRIENAGIVDGVIVETEDGRLRFDNSFEARVSRRRETLRRLVAEILFSEAPPAEHA